jgi:hypothetical protein
MSSTSSRGIANTRVRTGNQKVFEEFEINTADVREVVVQAESLEAKDYVVEKKAQLVESMGTAFRTLEETAQEIILLTVANGEELETEENSIFLRSYVAVGTDAGEVPLGLVNGFDGNQMLKTYAGITTTDALSTKDLIETVNRAIHDRNNETTLRALKTEVDLRAAELVGRVDFGNTDSVAVPTEDELREAYNVLNRAVKRRRLSVGDVVMKVYGADNDEI